MVFAKHCPCRGGATSLNELGNDAFGFHWLGLFPSL